MIDFVQWWQRNEIDNKKIKIHTRYVAAGAICSKN
jgi:hypothetical protein